MGSSIFRKNELTRSSVENFGAFTPTGSKQTAEIGNSLHKH